MSELDPNSWATLTKSVLRESPATSHIFSNLSDTGMLGKYGNVDTKPAVSDMFAKRDPDPEKITPSAGNPEFGSW